jgi:alkylation response protein AidB-like acyl-CoA dehydrogenase
MDFSLTEEQEMTAITVRDFARKEVAPVIKDADRRQEPLSGS